MLHIIEKQNNVYVSFTKKKLLLDVINHVCVKTIILVIKVTNYYYATIFKILVYKVELNILLTLLLEQEVKYISCHQVGIKPTTILFTIRLSSKIGFTLSNNILIIVLTMTGLFFPRVSIFFKQSSNLNFGYNLYAQCSNFFKTKSRSSFSCPFPKFDKLQLLLKKLDLYFQNHT